MHKSVLILIATVTNMVAGQGAFAHHSSAMFDQTKEVTLSGVVSKFEWSNPHALVFIDVDDAKGGTMRYTLECSTPNLLSHNGWKINTIRTGDRVTVDFFPLRDKRPGGMLAKITLPTGVVLKAW